MYSGQFPQRGSEYQSIHRARRPTIGTDGNSQAVQEAITKISMQGALGGSHAGVEVGRFQQMGLHR